MLTPNQLAKSGTEHAHQVKQGIQLQGEGCSNERMANLRRKRVALGLCRDCGMFPPIPGKVVCSNCSGKRNGNGKAYKAKRKKNGICAKCGKSHDRDRLLCGKCSETQIEEMRQRRKQNKIAVVKHFGGKCSCCNESDIRTLTVDHIDNNGNVDCKGKNGKRILSPTWYARLVKAINDKTIEDQKLQLLCFNCHAKKDLNPWWNTESEEW